MGWGGVLGLGLFTVAELLDNIMVGVLSDLFVGRGWPMDGRFLSN